MKHLQWPEFSLRGSRWSHSLDYLLQQTDGVNSSLEAKRLQAQEGLMFQQDSKAAKADATGSGRRVPLYLSLLWLFVAVVLFRSTTDWID